MPNGLLVHVEGDGFVFRLLEGMPQQQVSDLIVE